MIRVAVVAAAVVVAGCVGASADAARTTCAEWDGQLTPDQRIEVANTILSTVWSEEGATTDPPAEAVQSFADGVGTVCRGLPFDKVEAVGRAVYPTLDEIRPPGATPSPTPRASRGDVFSPDETVTIESGGVREAEVKVTEVEQFARYFGAAGDDVPSSDSVYIQVHMAYNAAVDGFAYGPSDWQVFSNGLPIDAGVTVVNGPEPKLGSGRLRAGDRAQGYLVFEVPATGEVVLAYEPGGDDSADGFDIVLRDSAREY